MSDALTKEWNVDCDSACVDHPMIVSADWVYMAYAPNQPQTSLGKWDICMLSEVKRGDGSCNAGCTMDDPSYNACQVSRNSDGSWTLRAIMGATAINEYRIQCAARCFTVDFSQ